MTSPSPDLLALQAMVALDEPARSAAINWLLARVAWEGECAESVAVGMQELSR